MVTTARRARRIRIVVLEEPERMPTLAEIEARQAAAEAAGIGRLVPKAWTDGICQALEDDATR